jgi:tRNA(fMet)-specific endonuclease VapC
MRGWLARIAQMKTPEHQVSVYFELKRQIRNYCDIAIVEFDLKAASEFRRLRHERVRIGTMDLKIAAIALANGATVITRNTHDFSRVPNLKIEDWSI